LSYAPDVSKALEAVLWVVAAKPGIDIYLVCKCLYFADVKHLSRYGRSIFGEKYIADTYGPRGEAAYGLMRHRMGELIALEKPDVPVRVMTVPPWTVTADRGPDGECLSESDVEALAEALAENGDKSFHDLYRETHAHPAYIQANGGIIDYRHMVSQFSDVSDEKLESIAEYAGTLR